jgi:hypothetical protein
LLLREQGERQEISFSLPKALPDICIMELPWQLVLWQRRVITKSPCNQGLFVITACNKSAATAKYSELQIEIRVV